MESSEKVPACKGVAKYSGAHLDSYGKFSQLYGYFEASIKSSAKGGTLTAFWLLPESGAWPPEVDVEEIKSDFPKVAYMPTTRAATMRRSISCLPPHVNLVAPIILTAFY
jgi:beta-glucanase (GH16 family)